jgi:MATE family multidrug resistance protein
MEKPELQKDSVQSLRSLAQYGTILCYFVPEYINAIVLYSLIMFDAALIAGLKATSAYAMVGITNALMVFIHKVAEGLSVGAVILCGQYQGRKEYPLVGQAAVAAVWATVLVGAVISGFLYCNAAGIFELLCVPPEMVALGIPFLRLRAISIFFMFVFFALIGFLRGVKNTKATMYLYLMGSVAFVITDYLLIHGNFGFPALGFNGSAIASIMQYGVMLSGAFVYILLRRDYRQYQIRFKQFQGTLLRKIFSLSWPVMCDKATLQFEKIWMVRLIAPMGAYALGALSVIKDLENLAFLPVAALGQIITILVSNEYGAGNFENIKISIKRVLILACCMMYFFLILFAYQPFWFMDIFDKHHLFSGFAAQAFPLVCILTFFDLLQLVLAGALRGTSNVRVVMATRMVTAILLFVPLSYALAHIPIENDLVRFVAIYGSYNVVNCVAAIVYYFWFHSGYWHRAPDKIA